jgi:hypothetical protein
VELRGFLGFIPLKKTVSAYDYAFFLLPFFFKQTCLWGFIGKKKTVSNYD